MTEIMKYTGLINILETGSYCMGNKLHCNPRVPNCKYILYDV